MQQTGAIAENRYVGMFGRYSRMLRPHASKQTGAIANWYAEMVDYHRI
jgi:hypothetical protein